ncbi:MAG: type II toxin-antitoxin system RatA family toxin [Pseudomonadota bacterium]|nr:type II toxin-antitoxin system RatA family toxin [Pseudomonadota bacterium]MED5274819.1 type II toxin-antitoxin system RatA family toxin [Pseudomonadota bacterium]|tara:strand:- start:98 stop:535 length:438 start_codon:yes stop_codon:yes gene_type:complete
MDYIKKEESINIDIETIFTLVNQVDKYSDFLPWCNGSKIISNENNIMIGEISVSKNLVKWTFTTENHYIDNEKIQLKLLDGPFKSLNGLWSFSRVDKNTTIVNFVLEYEFSNKIIELSIKPVFTSIMTSILDSFISEAFRMKYEK